jgi:hypothetical protein
VIAAHGVNGNNDAFHQAANSSLFFAADDFFAFIGPTAGADPVGLFWFLALGAEGKAGRGECIMGAAHVAFGFGGFLFRNCHD